MSEQLTRENAKALGNAGPYGSARTAGEIAGEYLAAARLLLRDIVIEIRPVNEMNEYTVFWGTD